MPNRKVPSLRQLKDGRFITTTHGRRKYLGRDPVKAKRAYDAWLVNVWTPDQALRSARMSEGRMPCRTKPTLRQLKNGLFITTYRRRRQNFGRDVVKAKRAFDDWLSNVWAPMEQALCAEIRAERKKPKRKQTINIPWKVPTELTWLAESLREYMSWKYPPSVYFLLQDEVLEYIGSTVDLPNRVRQHLQEGKKFDRVLWMPVEEERLRDVESRLIRMLKPGGNQRGIGKESLVKKKLLRATEAELIGVPKPGGDQRGKALEKEMSSRESNLSQTEV